MSTPISRRRFLAATAALAAATPLANFAAPAVPPVRLGTGTYGMKSLKTADALRTIAQIGYDGVELALMPGWATEAKLLSADARREIRTQLGDLNLALPALLESLPLKDTAESRTLNLERLNQAAALARELAPSHPPVVETILGLKTTEWDQAKGRMVEELKAWAKVADTHQVTICFKPHASNAVNSPERTLWLVKEVGSPRIRMVYDYSHMFIEGFPLEGSLKQLLPHTAFIAVKDAKGAAGKHEYLLPGDGQTDYVQYFKLLKQMEYRGFVIVEVSGQIHGKPGYDPVATAKLCYDRMSAAMNQAGIRPARRAA
jgi:sugar phosphate isomerase/epimerase